MSTIALEIQAIAVLVAVSCSLLGVFLVLRRMALLSDAISHTVLLGIVLVFFLTRDINSPLLILGATATDRDVPVRDQHLCTLHGHPPFVA